ncbi:hypothetical protein Zmor_016645 [Zophobas morio]|uniref:Uncharacterized protein n=1 Tax=Zophobas morio TaxID=2755281 RepID=A0AA38MB76_9CUCU|nr:hypothetical protein Zmor_016645 [Zophobas morio]
MHICKGGSCCCCVTSRNIEYCICMCKYGVGLFRSGCKNLTGLAVKGMVAMDVVLCSFFVLLRNRTEGKQTDRAKSVCYCWKANFETDLKKYEFLEFRKNAKKRLAVAFRAGLWWI